MSFSNTIAADYYVAADDHGETVTYLQGATTDSVPGAVVEEISRREVQAAAGLFTMQDLVFLLPTAQLALTPQEGDKITRADSTTWRVQDIRLEALGQQWRLVGHKER